MGLFDNTLQRIGLSRKEPAPQPLTTDSILGDLSKCPPALRDSIKSTFGELKRLEVVADPSRYYKTQIELAKKLNYARRFTSEGGPVDQAAKRFIFRSNGNVFGYTPASAKIWGHFANPMEVFSFLYDNWWAFKASVDLIDTEVEGGGFSLKAAKGVSQRRLQEVYKQIKDLQIDEMFVNSVTSQVQFGNYFLLPHTSSLNGKTLTKLEELKPNWLTPVFNVQTSEINSFVYMRGLVREYYTKDQLLQASMRSGQNIGIGTPPILPAVLEIESALYASMLNNTLFQKGGILGAILAMEEPKSDGDEFNITHSSDWLDLVQEKLNGEAGARGAFGLLALNGVKGMHSLVKPSDIDSSWEKGGDHAAKITAELAGVPPEKLGLVRSAALQYSPSLVEDSVNGQLDATINRLTSKQAKFWNNRVLEERMGIYDVKIVPTRRTGAKTKTATEALNNLSSAGGFITRNEGRVEWLHMEALLGPEGDEIVNTSSTINADSLPPRTPQQNPDPDFAALESGKAARTSDDSFYIIQVGGAQDGFIRKQC